MQALALTADPNKMDPYAMRASASDFTMCSRAELKLIKAIWLYHAISIEPLAFLRSSLGALARLAAVHDRDTGRRCRRLSNVPPCAIRGRSEGPAACGRAPTPERSQRKR